MGSLTGCSKAASQAGFTLLEVMIALAVLAITLMAILDLFNYDLALNGHSTNLTRASLLAQERVAAVELSGLRDVGVWTGTFPGYEGFGWKMQVEPAPLDFLREVRIQVFWQESKQEEAVEMTTFIFDER